MKTHRIAGGFAVFAIGLTSSAHAFKTHMAPTEVVRNTPAFAAIEYYPMANPPPGAALPFSEAVRVGDMLYLSGEIGTDKAGKLIAGDITAQARQTMDNIGANLARHGLSFDRVVQCTVALADIADWVAFNAVYRG